MALGLTYRGVDVFAPTDENGAPRSPSNQQAQVLTTEYERYISALTLSTNAAVVKGTLAELNAVVGSFANGDIGLVVTDATEANRGVYKRVSGAWVKQTDLPQDIAEQAQEAAEAAAEAAAASEVAAEAARDIALEAANDTVSQGNVPIFATQTGMTALTLPNGMDRIHVRGYSAITDRSAAVDFIRVATEPAHSGKFRTADRFLPAGGGTDATNGGWWEISPIGNVYANSFGFLPGRAGSDNNIALQAAIDYGRQQTETLLAGKYLIATSDVLIGPGEYTVSGAVELYTGVRLIGSGQSNTMLLHSGGASDFIVYTAVSTEVLYNCWVMDLTIKGGGKTISDTLSAVRASNNTGLALYGCGVTRCHIENCYDGIALRNSWTFEVSDCEMFDLGRNFIRGENMTACKIVGNRLDVAGEDGIYVTFGGTSAMETISLHLERTVVQSCMRRGIYGVDADHVMWDHCYLESCNQAGGYPHAEFASVTGVSAEMYSFVGGWLTPGSGETGQPAVKIAKARFVSIVGTYIRGSGFTYAFVLEAGVESYFVASDANTTNGILNVSGETTGIKVGRLSLDLNGIDSETHTTSQTGSSVDSNVGIRIREINCTASGRVFTLLNAHLQYGRRFTVQKVDGGSNNLVVTPEGTTKINGANASVSSSAAYARAEIYCGYEAGTTTLCWYVKFS